MKKFLPYVSPIVAALLTLTTAYKETLTGLHPHLPTALIVISLIGAIYNAYATIISPHRQLMEIKKERWKDLLTEASKAEKAYTNYIKINFNIVIPKKKLITCVEPWRPNSNLRKISFFPKIFKFVWYYEVPVGEKRLKLTTNQGCCGKSYKKTDALAYNLETHPNHSDFNFSKKQLKLTQDLTIVASYVIPGLKKEKPIILGILNAESRTKGAGVFADDDDLKQELFQCMKLIATRYEYYAKIE